jgi:hypothetical protein
MVIRKKDLFVDSVFSIQVPEKLTRTGTTKKVTCLYSILCGACPFNYRPKSSCDTKVA